ncbi:cysteine hydrolase family protein [Raoultibacter phocaeensis]|uniref:cysteine hydrolase family protein n=1 Tax=Raoultibacter phocaeensis TaxID=2479841 RepID=UPI001118475B|nr:isochorismatase family cysteine hydrolase [Raoultibacter phocaeensis]
MIEPNNAALIIIDMQNGFIERDSSLCIAGAKATLPACSRALDRARELGIPVFHVCREYAADGSDVESTRFETWLSGGKPISKACAKPDSLGFPAAVAPKGDDRVVVKPRFSAFFGTDLDETLRSAGITTVVLIGTTTPNCIRTTCYDALSLNYNVVIIEDCTSSRTPEVQAANIEDMAHIGAQVIDVDTFCTEGLASIRDIVSEHRKRVSL